MAGDAAGLYAGSLRSASFDSIATSGNGAIGIQVSRPLGTLELRGDLTTSGGEGSSLVQGVQTMLKAIALSIRPGGEIGTLTVGGRIGALDVAGGITASGAHSDAVHVHGVAPDLAHIALSAADGDPIVVLDDTPR